jgi:mxaJ protein
VDFSRRALACHPAKPARELRVCSDPNNLPFSNQRQEGFENRLAELIARELEATGILRRLKIGVQVVGDDYANTPPVHALSRRGIVDKIVGFRVVGDYSQANPPARIIDAVAAGEIDIAVAWGPLAGYFAKRSPVPLVLTPVLPAFDPPGLRFVFDISLAVRRDEQALERELDQILEKRKPGIDSILTEYGVPRVE